MKKQQMMKAIVCTEYGGPEVLQIREVSKPIPKDYEILIRIRSTSVNSGDARVRGLDGSLLMKTLMRLIFGLSKPRNPTLGTVFAGEIEKIGKAVKNFNVGNEVFGMTGFKFGTYAEYVTVSEKSNVILKPENASFEEAAAIIFGGQTAIYFLQKAKIDEGSNKKVLIIGATGSVGTAAVQIAQYYNANITAVCSSRGEELIRELNVNNVIFYDREDFTKRHKSYDIIFDAVGKSSKRACAKLLNKDGVFKTVGGIEYATETKDQLILLRKLFESQVYKATIDKVYPLEKIVKAHIYVDSGRKKGNIVINVK